MQQIDFNTFILIILPFILFLLIFFNFIGFCFIILSKLQKKNELYNNFSRFFSHITKKNNGTTLEHEQKYVLLKQINPMFFIPLLSIFIQLFIAIIFLYLLGYFPWDFILKHLLINFTNIVLPIIIIGAISLSFFLKNPVWVLLNILTAFLILGLLQINSGIEFITFFFIIVYLGALMMLFLFVIMLFDLQQLSKNNITKNIKIKLTFKIIFLFILIYP